MTFLCQIAKQQQQQNKKVIGLFHLANWASFILKFLDTISAIYGIMP